MKKANEEQVLDKIKKEAALSYAKRLTVSKRTDFIQRSLFGLTKTEIKIVNYMLTKVGPNDTYEKEYEFDIKTFNKAIGVKGKGIYNYKRTYNILKKLGDKSATLILEDDKGGKEYRAVRWFNTIHVEDRVESGKVKVKFHEDMAPYVFELAKQRENDKKSIFYITFAAAYTLPMSSRYSMQLYEILKSYQINHLEWFFELDDLKEKLAPIDEETGKPLVPKTWDNYAHFEKQVLRTCKEDINEFSDLFIDYVAKKEDAQGNKTASYNMIYFFMEAKTELEIEETNLRIYNELGYTEEELDGQIAFSFTGPDQTEYVNSKLDFIETRQKAKKEDLKNRASKSKHPIIMAYMDHISRDEKICNLLFKSAIKHCDIKDELSDDDLEVWAAELISHYIELIDADNKDEDNKCERLLGLVRFDRENYATTVTHDYLS